MTESATQILSHYLEKVGRTNIYSIEMERGKNPGELYYLCRVGNARYIVFESDYFSDLAQIAKEAASIFGDEVQPTHWLAKKDSDLASKTVGLYAKETKEIRHAIIIRPQGSWLGYAVLAAKVSWRDDPRFDPGAYGGSSS